MYNPYVIGKNIYLRHPKEEDAVGKWHEWFSDEETTRFLIDRFWPNSAESQVEFFKMLRNDRCRLVLSVIDKKSDQHIGIVSLGNINWVHRYSDFALVIGEKDFRKEAYAIEGITLILKIAFLRLNLETLKGAYVRSNQMTKAICNVFKFKEVGVYDNLLRINGKSEDLVAVMLGRESWMKRNKLL